jgi:tetratricopeptide (TPR) repeat protein
VVSALQPTLRQVEIERARRKPPANLDAYDFLLRALRLVLANTITETDTAIELLGEALRLNPDYAYAHALMAITYAQIYRSASGPERDKAQANAIAHARKALEVAGDDSTSLAYAGFVLLITEQDVAGARTALDRAVALNPNSATAYCYRALVLAASGEPRLAIENASRALRLSPFDPTRYLPQMAQVIAYIDLRQYDDAVAWAHEAIESAPPRYPMSYAWLIVAECARGNADEAQRYLERLVDTLPGFEPGMLAHLFDMFPEPLRSNSVAMLKNAGLVPHNPQVGTKSE